MSLPKEKAEEILELCLSSESQVMKTKVYEILSLSGIQTNDPMFLVLALTGQMRVFLETAPLELRELLTAWKSHSTESLAELSAAMIEVRASQKEQREAIQKTVEEINSQGVDNIRSINQEFITEILTSNTEVEQKTRDLVDELTQIQSKIDADRKSNIKLMQSLIEGMSQTYGDLDKINLQIQSSISSLEKVRIYRSKKWLVSAVILISGFLVIFGSSVGIAILKIQKPKQSSLFYHNWSQMNLSQQINGRSISLAKNI